MRTPLLVAAAWLGASGGAHAFLFSRGVSALWGASSRRASTRGAPIESSKVFEPKGLGVNPPAKVGFCALEPCTVADGEDCCCWSDAGVIEHPAYPNPDSAGLNKTCDTLPELDAAGYAMMKEPGDSAGSSGKLEAIEAVAPVYEDRDLCCVFSKLDPRTMSRETLAENVKKPPSTTPWHPKARLPTTPRPTGDPFKAQDLLAESLEKSAATYVTAAMAIKDTAGDLRHVLGEVEKADAGAHEKEKTSKSLKKVLLGYMRQANAAADRLGALAADTDTDVKEE